MNKKLFLVAFIIFFLAMVSILIGVLFVGLKGDSENLTSAENNVLPVPEPVFKEAVYGYSVLGKEIKGYEIGSGQKCILLFGSIHGNEMGSHDLLERLAIEIKQHPEKVLKDVKLIIIPVLNPDGLYDRTDKLNADGVNLDLNFETTGWKNYGPEGTYAGPAPFSEPESRAIKDIVEKNNVVIMISFHSYGSLVVPENNQSSMDLAKWYAEKTGYTYTGPDTFKYFGYVYFGTPTEWFFNKTGNTGLTIELTDHFSSDWDINKDALMELISSEK